MRVKVSRNNSIQLGQNPTNIIQFDAGQNPTTMIQIEAGHNPNL